jgi:hypothetical protein
MAATHDSADITLSAKISELDNRGDPTTTALVIAYELMSKRLQEVSYRRKVADESQRDESNKPNERFRITIEQKVAAEIGSLAGTILARAERAVGILREEPNDPVPGCHEAPGSTCDFPGGPDGGTPRDPKK